MCILRIEATYATITTLIEHGVAPIANAQTVLLGQRNVCSLLSLEGAEALHVQRSSRLSLRGVAALHVGLDHETKLLSSVQLIFQVLFLVSLILL